MIDFDSKKPVESEEKEQEEPEMVDLFTLDGKTYSIPNVERPMTGIRYLHIARTQGLGYAEAWLGAEVMGREMYEILLDIKSLNPEDLNAIMKITREIAYGTYVPKAQKEQEVETPNGSEPSQNAPTQLLKKSARKPSNTSKTMAG